MSHAPRQHRRLASALGLSLALATTSALAQQTSPSGTNISTGSGAGTGTMPPPTSTGETQLPDLDTPGGAAPVDGPGQRRIPPINPTAPRDPSDMPSSIDDLLNVPRFPDEGTGPIFGIPSPYGGYGTRSASPEQVEAIEARLVEDARAINNPADRALAFDRAAQAMILADHWDAAQQALIEGGQAAIQISESTRHDLRLQALVSTALTLAEELTRAATVSEDYSSLDLSSPAPRRTISERLAQIKQVREVIALASQLGTQIRNANYSAYSLARVAESQATNSATVATYATRLPRRGEDSPREDNTPLATEAEAMLREARNVAWLAPLSVWRDQTLVRVVGAAAVSAQFAEGAQIAQAIRHPEARSDAQIRLAESMARRGLQTEATEAYQRALTSVVSIPLEDPRQTLGAVLLDSLLAVGRFEDARLTSGLILKPAIRKRALSAIAKSMGERGLADEAVAWIDREAEPELRDRLRREVSEGLVIWLQQNRATPGGLRMSPRLLTPSELEGVLPRPGGGNP